MWICNIDIPPELLDLILSFAKDDCPTLQACALTCRDWHAATRPHLFRDVVLDGMKSLERLEEAIRYAPILGSLIQTLKLRELQRREQEYGWTLSAHYSLPNKVTRLHTIELKNINSSRTHIMVQYLPLLPFTSTTTLIIDRCFFKFETLASHISALPELRTLERRSLLLLKSEWDEELQLAIARCPLRLDFLLIRSISNLFPLNKWILGSTLKKNLRRLRLTINEIKLAAINQLLRGLVDSLVDLDLERSWDAYGLDLYSLLRPNLRPFHVFDTFPGSLVTGHWSLVISNNSTFTCRLSPTMTHLIFILLLFDSRNI